MITFLKQTLGLCCVELIKRLRVHQYSVDICAYSGTCTSGILCSDGKYNNNWAGAVGVGVDALSTNFNEQIQ